MTQKIKDFFTQKRCKKFLNNNRGFSLLEVLVAVGIIGIISAIAYPAFDDYRQNAARVSSDTSGSNIVKALKTCLVLKDLSGCNTLAKLKIPCPSGSTCGVETSGTKFCADIKNGQTGSEKFKVCVEYDTATQTEKRTYGGTLLDKICKYTIAGSSCTPAAGTHPESPVKTCSADSDCTGGSVSGAGCTKTNTCAASGNNGVCQSSGLCG